jgi:hypothetical protein
MLLPRTSGSTINRKKTCCLRWGKYYMKRGFCNFNNHVCWTIVWFCSCGGGGGCTVYSWVEIFIFSAPCTAPPPFPHLRVIFLRSAALQTISGKLAVIAHRLHKVGGTAVLRHITNPNHRLSTHFMTIFLEKTITFV